MSAREGTVVRLHKARPRSGNLDRIDLKILAALQTDGRMTNLRLAELVGLSPTPSLQRVRRLEADGYILAYGATLDVARLGTFITVYTDIALASRTKEYSQPFERYVRACDMIVECCAVTGEYSYIVKSLARDVAHYQAMMEDMLDRNLGIANFKSYIAVHPVKQAAAFPLSLIAPEGGEGA